MEKSRVYLQQMSRRCERDVDLIRRIEKCERKLQTQKEENTLEIWNMAKKILEQPQRLSEEIRSTEKNDEFVEKFIRS